MDGLNLFYTCIIIYTIHVSSAADSYATLKYSVGTSGLKEEKEKIVREKKRLIPTYPGVRRQLAFKRRSLALTLRAQSTYTAFVTVGYGGIFVYTVRIGWCV